MLHGAWKFCLLLVATLLIGVGSAQACHHANGAMKVPPAEAKAATPDHSAHANHHPAPATTATSEASRPKPNPPLLLAHSAGHAGQACCGSAFGLCNGQACAGDCHATPPLALQAGQQAPPRKLLTANAHATVPETALAAGSGAIRDDRMRSRLQGLGFSATRDRLRQPRLARVRRLTI